MNYIEHLQANNNQNWEHIKRGKVKAEEDIKKLNEVINSTEGLNFSGLSNDMDFIVYGSIARKEACEVSDLDWAILVDGQANLHHKTIHQDIKKALEEKEFIKPGAAGFFGNLIFSHDLVHFIGGLNDNNINLTQRILLLLESSAVRNESSETTAYGRILKNLLLRYISIALQKRKAPRFLLNDLVRYWRTICVDFAAKEWENPGEKWAIRNLKLRTSRKLIFVKGLLLSFYLNEFSRNQNESAFNHTWETVKLTPLEITAKFIIDYNIINTGLKLFSAYDQFLELISSSENREKLKNLRPDNAENDDIFKSGRDIGHQFQSALTDMFYNDDTPLKKYIIEYGVF